MKKYHWVKFINEDGEEEITIGVLEAANKYSAAYWQIIGEDGYLDNHRIIAWYVGKDEIIMPEWLRQEGGKR